MFISTMKSTVVGTDCKKLIARIFGGQAEHGHSDKKSKHHSIGP